MPEVLTICYMLISLKHINNISHPFNSIYSQYFNLMLSLTEFSSLFLKTDRIISNELVTTHTYSTEPGASVAVNFTQEITLNFKSSTSASETSHGSLKSIQEEQTQFVIKKTDVHRTTIFCIPTCTADSSGFCVYSRASSCKVRGYKIERNIRQLPSASQKGPCSSNYTLRLSSPLDLFPLCSDCFYSHKSLLCKWQNSLLL